MYRHVEYWMWLAWPTKRGTANLEMRRVKRAEKATKIKPWLERREWRERVYLFLRLEQAVEARYSEQPARSLVQFTRLVALLRVSSTFATGAGERAAKCRV